MGAMVIALSGKGNSGKTTTLKKLMSLLCSRKAEVKDKELCSPIPRGDEHLANSSLEEMLGGKGDVRAVFCCNGMRIGITSQGDAVKYLKDDLEWMGDCDIYVCASLSYGQTVEFVKNFATKISANLLINQRLFVSRTNDNLKTARDEINSLQAQIILGQIKESEAANETA